MCVIFEYKWSTVVWGNIKYFIDGSPPGSAVPGILQARTLEWVAIAFSQQTPTEGVISYHVSLPDLCLLDLMGGKRWKTVFSCSQFRQAWENLSEARSFYEWLFWIIYQRWSLFFFVSLSWDVFHKEQESQGRTQAETLSVCLWTQSHQLLNQWSQQTGIN